MAWLETPRFPESISLGSVGGPELRKTRTETRSGRKYTNEDWLYPLHDFNVVYGVRTPTEIEVLNNYFLAVGGSRFRYKDWHDYKSCGVESTPAFGDQSLGTGNGSNKDFPIFKTYPAGALSRLRPILTPVIAGFLVGKDSVNQASGWALTFVNNIWIVRFTAAPADAAVLTWGGEFDTPCEFGDDKLPKTLDNPKIRSTRIMVAEVRALV